MAKTVVGLFDTNQEAQEVVRDLVDAGFDRNNISLVANDAKGEYANYKGGRRDVDGDGNDNKAAEGAGGGAVTGGLVGGGLGLLVGIGALAIPGIGPVLAAGPIASALASTAVGAGIGAAAGGLLGALVGAGVPEDDAHFYTEGVRRGGTLVMVNSPDEQAQRAYDIMQRHGAVDIDERGSRWREEGWERFDTNAQPYNTTQVEEYRTRSAQPAGQRQNVRQDQGDAVIPVVEEELQVGKQQVQGGGVRVYSQMVKQPVQEQVQLRQERVEVERRPANRQVTEGDMAAFREGAVEVTTTEEVPVVNKQARVVEEVVVDKEVEQRTETVSDTVRRTDVQVEEVPGQVETRRAGEIYNAERTDTDRDQRRY